MPSGSRQCRLLLDTLNITNYISIYCNMKVILDFTIQSNLFQYLLQGYERCTKLVLKENEKVTIKGVDAFS